MYRQYYNSTRNTLFVYFIENKLWSTAHTILLLNKLLIILHKLRGNKFGQSNYLRCMILGVKHPTSLKITWWPMIHIKFPVLQYHGKKRNVFRTSSCLERLGKNQVVASRVAGIFTINFLHLSSVKEPISNRLCNGLFSRFNVRPRAKYWRSKPSRLEEYWHLHG